MAWEPVEWACGHEGAKQLYGPGAQRQRRIAYEAGRDCFACWLVGEWEAKEDPRAQREDRYILAEKIAEGKGTRIRGLPESVPVKARSNRQELEIERAKLAERIAAIDEQLKGQ